MSLPHSNHPGHSARSCDLSITVDNRSNMSMNGYACSFTGGHCTPNEHCSERLKIDKEEKAKLASFLGETNFK